MSNIVKRPAVSKNPELTPEEAAAAAATFIGGAPDAAKKPRKTRSKTGERTPVIKGNKEQLTVTLPLGMIDELDVIGKRYGLPRTSVVSQALRVYIDGQNKGN